MEKTIDIALKPPAFDSTANRLSWRRLSWLSHFHFLVVPRGKTDADVQGGERM